MKKRKIRKSGFIAARVPDDIAAQIYEMCKKELKISMSEFMRQAAERELKRLQQRAR